MVRKKSSESAAEPKKTGDPFFDDPPEVYWAKNKKTVADRLTASDIEEGIKEGWIATPHSELKPNKTGPQKFGPGYHVVGETPDIEQDFKELNTLMIPLTELRLKIAELQTMGLKKMPLGDLLLTIKEVYRENKDG